MKLKTLFQSATLASALALSLVACVPPELSPGPDAGNASSDMGGNNTSTGMSTNTNTSVATNTTMTGGTTTSTGGGTTTTATGTSTSTSTGTGTSTMTQADPNPYIGDADRAANGQQTFSQCAGCHSGGGTMATFGTGKVLKETGDMEGSQYIFDKIDQGVKNDIGVMKAYGGDLTVEEIWELVTYIQSL